ncbi:hypothetical protein C0993_008616 [Termitomyces sp. T159_Od127]|nr:hypothetical protein C0993_008616 [Termitomyces sp. T159_Od127]
MGDYPIFIYSARPSSALDIEFVTPRMELMTEILSGRINVKRVFSVFSLTMVSEVFVHIWSEKTCIVFYKEPYYDAKLTYCTRQSFRPRQYTMLHGLSYDLRLGVPSDVFDIAKLCHGFAAEAKPFVLTEERAVEEARNLLSLNQVWVHTIKEGDQPTEIACIVAVTRESVNVSAITKVFTNPSWRSRGCAERLVRKVTQNLLKRKESVVLYVAHNNPAASKVYNRVGFVGLDNSMPPVNGVDSWQEIGFDRDEVVLGHW